MTTKTAFAKLGLASKVVDALSELGYETPTPIQAQSIPPMLSKQDVLAQAQTGTGKTAAFALPILTQFTTQSGTPYALVLTPTRELSIQVSEAFQAYAKYLTDFHVVPIYGGADYRPQLAALRRGVHIVVGTPGRVMDHLRRGTLSLATLEVIVLDEADEMLKMGFIDDIEWILEQIQGKRQVALFSATLPETIKRIAARHLQEPVKIHIEPKEKTVAAIEQCFTIVPEHHKLAVLTRFLEAEEFEAAIVFTRTKNNCAELAEKLSARGYRASALHGDLDQALREKIIKRLKSKDIDIVVATEVAARGLDVERIGYVINYDIPYDPESYVHRIGRTGRAGRKGRAVLFVTPRERHMLKAIERMLQQQITMVDPPSVNQIHARRDQKLIDNILQAVDADGFPRYHNLLERLLEQTNCALPDIAAALLSLVKQQQKPVDVLEGLHAKPQFDETREPRHNPRGRSSSKPRFGQDRPHRQSGSGERSDYRTSDRQRDHKNGQQRSVKAKSTHQFEKKVSRSSRQR